MPDKKPSLVIGFITYGAITAKYLPYFLASLKEQTFKDFKILALDNSPVEDQKNVVYLNKNYPEIEIERPGENLGFACGFNRLIRRGRELGAQYFMMLNPDLVLEPDALDKLVKAIEADSQLGSVCPKILGWDFANNIKTRIIDSCGIQLKPGLRFVDVGQNQQDQGQFDNTEILGPSGAAAMYRIEALENVKQAGQYFDELMFMYKEDCDLAYRLFLAGYKSSCLAEAIIYHDRTAQAGGETDLRVVLNRRRKSRQVKQWSFLGQQIIFIKYWQLQNWINKLALIWYELKMIVFILLFEQYLLGQFWELRRLREKIKRYNR